MEVHSNLTNKVNVFTKQKFAVIMEEVDVPLSPTPLTNGHEDQSVCSCIEEIKSLKETVKQLILQVNQQNQAITEIKSGIRSAVLSLSSCYADNNIAEENYNNQDVEYLHDQHVTTVSEIGNDFDDQLLPQDPVQNLSSTQCEQTEDPLQDVTTCGSSSIENGISNDENIINRLARSRHPSQAVLIQNEASDDDDLESGDIDEINDNDMQYDPSKTDNNSDQDLDDDNDDENELRSLNSTRKSDHPKETSGIQEGTSSKDGFRCTKCPKEVIYKTRRTLKEHMRRYHSKDPHKCKLCDKVYVKSSSLAHHIHSVHKGNRLKCAYCPGSFVQLGKLRVHEKIHLEKGGPPLQCCEFCGMNFRTVKSLLAHLGAMHKDTDQRHYAIGVKTIKNKQGKRK